MDVLLGLPTLSIHFVNLRVFQIVEKLSVSTPSPQVKLKLLKEIAREYNVEWDSSKTESELSRKPEDLLVTFLASFLLYA